MKYISITGVDRNKAALWGAAAQRIGLSLTAAPSPYVLPLSGVGAWEMTSRVNANYMTPEALRVVSDRRELAKLGVPVLPTLVPLSADALLAFGDGPVFLKPADTSKLKKQNQLTYTKWDSVQHLAVAVDAEFWAAQQNPDTAFSVQPLVPYPISEMTAYVSVNEASEVLVYHSSLDTSEIVDRRSLIEQPTPVPDYVRAAVQTVCTALNIKGGIHDAQFILLDGQWYLNDWNARPGGISEGLVPAKNVMESALAHMVGDPVPDVPPFYGEQRGYWGRGIPMEMANVARTMGMFPRCNEGFLSRVYCEDVDVASVQERLNLFEQHL